MYNYTPYALYYCNFVGDFVEWLVSDEDAACAAGVICFFEHYWPPANSFWKKIPRKPLENDFFWKDERSFLRWLSNISSEFGANFSVGLLQLHSTCPEQHNEAKTNSWKRFRFFERLQFLSQNFRASRQKSLGGSVYKAFYESRKTM